MIMLALLLPQPQPFLSHPQPCVGEVQEGVTLTLTLIGQVQKGQCYRWAGDGQGHRRSRSMALISGVLRGLGSELEMFGLSLELSYVRGELG